MKEFYEIECDILKVFIKKLKENIKEIRHEFENCEYNIMLDDFYQAVTVAVQLAKNKKINVSTTVLRSSFELIFMYLAINKNDKIKEEYMNVTKKRNIKKCIDEISQYIERESEALYNDIYGMLCEMSHPTLLRNYFCDVSKNKNGLEVNINIILFIITLMISEYISYINIFLNKKSSNLSTDILVLMLLYAFICFLNNQKADPQIIQKYQSLYANGDITKGEYFKSQLLEFQESTLENKDIILKTIEENFEEYNELKLRITNYIKKNMPCNKKQ